MSINEWGQLGVPPVCVVCMPAKRGFRSHCAPEKAANRIGIDSMGPVVTMADAGMHTTHAGGTRLNRLPVGRGNLKHPPTPLGGIESMMA
ncbi:MAG: hypothetical protein LAO21_06745 [Acidobacteriia bacterium]|nr:hypothetical protein [Terriglobia bacterium]